MYQHTHTTAGEHTHTHTHAHQHAIATPLHLTCFFIVFFTQKKKIESTAGSRAPHFDSQHVSQTYTYIPFRPFTTKFLLNFIFSYLNTTKILPRLTRASAVILLLATAVLGVSQGWLFTIVGEGQNERTNERKKKYNVWKFRSKSICVFLDNQRAR